MKNSEGASTLIVPARGPVAATCSALATPEWPTLGVLVRSLGDTSVEKSKKNDGYRKTKQNTLKANSNALRE